MTLADPNVNRPWFRESLSGLYESRPWLNRIRLLSNRIKPDHVRILSDPGL